MRSGPYFALLLTFSAIVAVAAENQPDELQVAQKIPLEKVQGVIGPLTVDEDAGMLFAATPENNSIEVIDLKRGAAIRTLSGVPSPGGMLYVASMHRLYVTSGDAVEVFDPATGTRDARIVAGPGAGSLAWDAASRRIYAGIAGGLAVIDPSARKKVAEVKLAGDPGTFQLEAAGPRIFVNLPGKSAIAVVDRNTRAVISTLPVTWAHDNISMALDEKNQRLLVGTRSPGKLLVLDTTTLQWITEVVLSDELGDVIYDSRRHEVLALCGRAQVPGFAGVIIAMHQFGPDHYKIAQQTITARGTRSAVYGSGANRLYVALPAGKDQAAEIRSFDLR